MEDSKGLIPYILWPKDIQDRAVHSNKCANPFNVLWKSDKSFNTGGNFQDPVPAY